MSWAGHVASIGEVRNAYKILVGKPERKKPLVRPRGRCFRMALREIGWGDPDWIHLAQDRYQWRALVNMMINLRVP
jgi:hypothetical protein